MFNTTGTSWMVNRKTYLVFQRNFYEFTEKLDQSVNPKGNLEDDSYYYFLSIEIS